MHRTIATILFVFGTSVAGSATAQPECEEPTAAAYVAEMAEMRSAVNEGRFDEVLRIAEWGVLRYPYAPLHYTRARALHHLERWSDAEAAYNDFLRAYAECPDPAGLVSTAREYRLQAIRFREAESSGFDAAWIPVILGGALVAGGITHDLIRRDLLDDKEAAAARGDQEAYNEADEKIADARIVDYVLYGGGVAAVAVGVILLLVNDDEPESIDDAATVGWVPLPSGAMFTFGGRF